VANKKVAKSITPRLLGTLLVGNESEGKIHEVYHVADTLSTLLS